MGATLCIRRAENNDTTSRQDYTVKKSQLLFRADTLRREIAGFAEEEVKRGASGKKRSRGKRGQRSPESGRRVVPLES